MFADEDFEQLLILLSTIIHLQPVFSVFILFSSSELMAGFCGSDFCINAIRSCFVLFLHRHKHPLSNINQITGALLFMSQKSLRRGNDFKPSPEQSTQTGSLTRRQGVENVPETFQGENANSWRSRSCRSVRVARNCSTALV